MLNRVWDVSSVRDLYSHLADTLKELSDGEPDQDGPFDVAFTIKGSVVRITMDLDALSGTLYLQVGDSADSLREKALSSCLKFPFRLVQPDQFGSEKVVLSINYDEQDRMKVMVLKVADTVYEAFFNMPQKSLWVNISNHLTPGPNVPVLSCGA